MARYLQQAYWPQGFPLPVGSQAPTDQSLVCAPMVRSFEPVAARSPVSVTIEQRTAREAVRNCCRTEFASQHVLRSSWSLLLEERRSILVVMRPCHGRSCLLERRYHALIAWSVATSCPRTVRLPFLCCSLSLWQVLTNLRE